MEKLSRNYVRIFQASWEHLYRLSLSRNHISFIQRVNQSSQQKRASVFIWIWKCSFNVYSERCFGLL